MTETTHSNQAGKSENQHAAHHPGPYSIIVNGRQRQVSEHKLTYLEVVKLAYPDAQFAENIVYTVTYSDPHTGHDQSMVAGDTVDVKNGMIFNVVRTDKS